MKIIEVIDNAINELRLKNINPDSIGLIKEDYENFNQFINDRIYTKYSVGSGNFVKTYCGIKIAKTNGRSYISKSSTCDQDFKLLKVGRIFDLYSLNEIF